MQLELHDSKLDILDVPGLQISELFSTKYERV